MNQPKYTVIHHEVRKKFRITNDEYCLADSIDKLSNKLDFPWCVTEKKDLGKFIGVSERTIYRMTAKLAKKGIIESDGDGNLRTTPLWSNLVTYITTAKVAKPTAKVADNNNINNKDVSKDTSWDLKKSIKALEDSDNRALNIIALYWELTQPKFPDRKRAAKDIGKCRKMIEDFGLAKYQDKDLVETMKWLAENADFPWHLGTVGTYITRDLSKLRTKKHG